MTSIEINDIKKFMNSLFVKDCFDVFLCIECTIKTFATFIIDGTTCSDFFTIEEKEEGMLQSHALWKTIRPYCFDIIKGKKTPVMMKFVFSLSPNGLHRFIQKNDITIKEEEINSLFLNIRFENDKATVITGTSLRTFTLDKSIENAWDEYICKFISSIQNV